MCDFLLLLKKKNTAKKGSSQFRESGIHPRCHCPHADACAKDKQHTAGRNYGKEGGHSPRTRKCGDSLSHAAAIMDGLAWDGSMLFRVLTGIWTWHLAIPNEEWRAVTGCGVP